MSNYNQQELELIQSKANALHISNPNWPAIGISGKRKNNTLTDELAIVLLVDKKLPVDQIDSNNLFPKSITIPGIDEPIKTDVQEADINFKGLACYNLPVPGENENTWEIPVSGHRSTLRPLSGGLSLGIFGPRGYNHPTYMSMETGTLGGFAIDLDDNTVVGVSNNHVIGGRQVRGDALSAYTNSKGLTYWSILSANDTTPAEGETRYPVYQRSTHDEWTDSKSVLDTLKVGTVKRAYPLTPDDNPLDIAIFALDTTVPGLFSRTETWKQYQLARQHIDGAMDWATTAEITSLVVGSEVGAPVFHSSRTSGPLGWPGSHPHGSFACSLSVLGLYNIRVNLGFPKWWGADPENYPGVARFTNQILISSYSGAASEHGDSGSFVCALFNEGNVALSAWKVIGLLFAGSGTTAGVNRIDTIAEKFNLSAYKGEDLDIGYKNVDIKVVNSRQSAVTALIGGHMYWQAGSTNDFGKHYSNFGE